MRSTSISSTSHKALRAARHHLEQVPRPQITAVGPASRTWYVDRYLLRFCLLQLAAVDPLVMSGGNYPFDLMLEEACAANDLECRPSYLLDRDLRLRKSYKRPPKTWLATDLVVVFPGVDEPIESADPFLLKLAVPFLVIPREGDWTLTM